MKQFYKPNMQRRSSCPIDMSSEIRKLSMKNKTHILTEFQFMQLAKMTKSGAKYLTKEKKPL